MFVRLTVMAWMSMPASVNRRARRLRWKSCTRHGGHQVPGCEHTHGSGTESVVGARLVARSRGAALLPTPYPPPPCPLP